jgi:hypothetical protein
MTDSGRADGLPGPARPRHAEDFDALYTGTPPWDIGRPQPAFVALADAGAVRGRVLDVGCGTGEHALMAAGLGLDVTGVDVDTDRAPFVENLGVVTRPGGRYFMLCFSDRQPGDWGPRRITQDEIKASFDDGWQVDSIEPATIDITIDPDGARGWLATIIRS